MRHDSWSKFEQWRNEQGYRLVLFTTKSPGGYLDYRYKADDILLFGRESAGVPDEVVAAADARVVIPIKPGLRSLNVAVAAAMALGEALRQTGSASRRRRGELRGQGNLSDPAGRRRACRPRGGVLPFLRLQSLERPRAGPRHRDLPVLRHRLRRHRRHAGRPLRLRRRTRRHHRRAMGREPTPTATWC